MITNNCNNDKNDISDEQLVEMAKKAMENAYSPYSHFSVGAALITDDGSVYTGCNIENASYGATNCAERTAIFKAVSDGHRLIRRIVIVSSSNKKTPPCGICRQVMSEFMNRDGKVILTEKDKIISYNIAELLPESFKL